MWSYVVPHFEKFLTELELSPVQRTDAEGKAERIARKLFARYYPGYPQFDSRCFAIVGSYGKGTAARPKTDVDMIFVLPPSEYQRVNGLAGRQSAFLQEVKNELLERWPSTDIRGDGPVVKVPFDSYEFEVCPVFRLQDDTFITPHTKNGGRWGVTNPAAEIAWLKAVDARTGGKATHLNRMLKAWKRECSVDIKSISLEVLATLFVDQWPHNGQTIYYYDWMVRDFFAYLLKFAVGGWVQPAGITERIILGDKWQSKCLSAYRRATKACEYERADDYSTASIEWNKIFGSQFRIDYQLGILATFASLNSLAGSRA